jgi:hypothetical protein
MFVKMRCPMKEKFVKMRCPMTENVCKNEMPYERKCLLK